MPDIVITPASANIVFSSTANAGFIRLDTSTNTLIIQANGGVQLGNTASDVYVGDGVNSIDIVYEQNGDIRALGGKTLNIGQGNSYVVLVGQTSMTGAFSGPIKSNVAVGTAVLELDGAAIIRKTTTGGALMIGKDDAVHIAAGESQTRIQQLFANSSEEVVLGAEGGIHLLTSSNNWGEAAAVSHVMSWTGRGVSVGGGLGLGTTAATATLDVRGNANVSTTLAAGNTTVSGFIKASNAIFTSASQIRLKTADTTSGYGVIHRHDGSDYYTLVTNNNDADGGWNSLRPFSFNLASGSVYLGGSNLTVVHGGNVGVGTTSPPHKFHVEGTSEWLIGQRYASDTTTNRGTIFLSQRARGSLGTPTVPTSGTILGGIAAGGWNTSAYTQGWNGGAEILFLATQTWTSTAEGTEIIFYNTADGAGSQSERMKIAANGNVGIGNSAPTDLLRVQGNISTSANVTAVNFNSTSDIKLKSNILTITNANEIVDKIRGVTFNWIDGDKPSVGVIAQEIEQVLPELVDSSSEVKTVNYDGLTALLLQAVKELKQEVETLKHALSNPR